MNPKYVLSTLAVATVVSNVDAIGVLALPAAGAVTLTLGAGLGPALAVGGLAVLKAAALGAGAGFLAGRRGRRSVEETGGPTAEAVPVVDEATAFAVVSEVEPQQCYQRLICELSTGQMPESKNDVILNLFKNGEPAETVDNPKKIYEKAARLGELVKDLRVCELQYSCPLTGEQIDKLI